MQSILNIASLSKTNKLILAAFAFLAVLTLGSGRAHAATLNVTGGCTLPIAISSVNAGANQSGCTATVSPDAYGTNDTITIPAGTQTLTANLPVITEDVVVNGAGMNQTIIDGDAGGYKGIEIDGSTTVTISNLKIVDFKQFAILSRSDSSVTIDHVEIDGTNALANSGDLQGIFAQNNSSNNAALTISNVYIHDLVGSTNILGALLIDQFGGGTFAVDLQNITIANVSNELVGGGGTIGVMLSVGLWGNTFGSSGTLSTVASNITIDNIHSTTTLAAPFSSNSYSNGGDSNVETIINNVTVTNTDGVSDPLDVAHSAAFYAAGVGIGAGTTATSTISVGNSLMAHNLSEGSSNNCAIADFTSLASGQGTGVVSVTSLGHNIVDDNSCASSFTQPSDQHNVVNIIPTLGPLQNNGGNVPTRALLEGSPAIAAGGAVLGVTTDARGIARPGTCPSVGAFQFEGAVCAASTTSGGSNAGAPNTGVGPASLIQFITGFTGFGLVALALRRRISAN